jgi:hypothetical protein
MSRFVIWAPGNRWNAQISRRVGDNKAGQVAVYPHSPRGIAEIPVLLLVDGAGWHASSGWRLERPADGGTGEPGRHRGAHAAGTARRTYVCAIQEVAGRARSDNWRIGA